MTKREQKPSLAESVPSLRKMTELAKQARVLSWMEPVVRRLGKTGAEIAAAMRNANISTMARDAAELAVMPDRFNAHFLSRGWIAYELLSTEVMKQAISFADTGGLEQAELVLVEAHNADAVAQKLLFVRGIEPFSRRSELLELVLEDYRSERYHAVAPVLLAQIDGIVADLSGHAFFASGRNVIAWDSFSAHERGLQALADACSTTRSKTNTDPISLPYRHGILHGRDLAYNNRQVAAKSWAMLLALRAWAIAKRAGNRPPEERPKPNLMDSLRSLAEGQRLQSAIEAWKARDAIRGLGEDATQESSDYPENQPERAVVEFLSYWRLKNYGRMARLMPGTREENPNARAGEARARFGDFELESFKLLAVDEHAVGANVTAELRFKGRSPLHSAKIRTLCENDAGNVGLRGSATHSWRIYDDFAYHLWDDRISPEQDASSD